ncbi:putative ribonucleoside-diphosphate reductase [Helianthus annuus]|uniref:Ribonucleoside-diphosphate reductase n=1 Tax=Helianthus annuus TaxID=4232 RepID=A0A251TGT0_HELAN|nr:putative ribonucleoside-diphosphate reductase [Helianthus annuus]
MDQPNYNKLTSLHFHVWLKGLKTGMYFLLIYRPQLMHISSLLILPFSTYKNERQRRMEMKMKTQKCQRWCVR